MYLIPWSRNFNQMLVYVSDIDALLRHSSEFLLDQQLVRNMPSREREAPELFSSALEEQLFQTRAGKWSSRIMAAQRTLLRYTDQ